MCCNMYEPWGHKISRSQKEKYIILHMRYEEGGWEWLFNGWSSSSKRWKPFWRWMVGMIVQHCECIWCHRTVHSKMAKMVNFMYMYILPHFENMKKKEKTTKTQNLILIPSEISYFRGNHEEPMDEHGWWRGTETFHWATSWLQGLPPRALGRISGRSYVASLCYSLPLAQASG